MKYIPSKLLNVTPREMMLPPMATVNGVLGFVEALTLSSCLSVSEFLSNPENKARVEEEVADVAIYLIRLAQVMNIDLINAIRNKIEVNSLKYPIETSKGNATKYSERENN